MILLLPYPGVYFPLPKRSKNVPLYPLIYTPINLSFSPLKYLKMA
nr:MAG TPA: hypothetical protein [Caudoviricetes sp.]